MSVSLRLCVTAWLVLSLGSEAMAQTPAFDWAHWKLTLPTDVNGRGKADEVVNPAGYTNPPWFQPAPAGVLFRANAGGARTSNSTAYARSELREMTAGGRPAAWDCTGAVRVMQLEQTLLHTTTAKPEVTLGQIHDARNDNLMIKYAGPADANGEHDTGRIEVLLNDASQPFLLDPAYTLGDTMQVRVAVDQGAVQVDYRNLRSGLVQRVTGRLDPAAAVGACYFKAGIYIQACSRIDSQGKPNPVCAKKGWAERRYDAPDAWAEVRVSSLRLE